MGDVTILRTLRKWGRIGGVILWTAFAVLLLEIHELFNTIFHRASVFAIYQHIWCGGVLKIFGIKINKQLLSVNLSKERGQLLVANHRSLLDILLLIYFFDGSFLSREDVQHWPLIGRCAQKAGTVFVNRKSKQSGSEAIKKMRSSLQQGKRIIVFPEGTTFSGDKIRTFRLGAFVAARNLDIDIIPIAFAYPPFAEFTQPSSLAHIVQFTSKCQTPVAMVVGQTMHPGNKGIEDLAKHCHQTVQTLAYQSRTLLR